MKDIQHYKDEVAKEHGNEDFNDMLLKTSVGKVNDIINYIMQRYAEEACREQKEIDYNLVSGSDNYTDAIWNLHEAKLATDKQ